MDRIPKLPGFLTFAEVGVILGVTRQAVHKMAGANQIHGIVYVGPEEKPVYLVPEREVAIVAKERAQLNLVRRGRQEEAARNPLAPRLPEFKVVDFSGLTSDNPPSSLEA